MLVHQRLDMGKFHMFYLGISVIYTGGGGIELSKGFEKWAASRSFPLSRELDVSLNKTRK